jgi:WD40 repeat protein
VRVIDQHEDSIYSVAWSPADAWMYCSLSYDGTYVQIVLTAMRSSCFRRKLGCIIEHLLTVFFVVLVLSFLSDLRVCVITASLNKLALYHENATYFIICVLAYSDPLFL